MRTVEINGIKLEIDERTARTVEQYKIGDKVKVLVKASYGDTYSLHPGVIIGFAPFVELPTIEVLYVKTDSFSGDTDPFTIVGINAMTEGVEIAPLNDLEVMVDRDAMVVKFDAAIRVAEAELAHMKDKREYFVEHFARHFDDVPEGLKQPVED